MRITKPDGEVRDGGRRNGFEMKVGRLKASSKCRRRRRTEILEGVEGLSSSPTRPGVWGKLFRNLCANWCILERKSLLKLIIGRCILIAFITTSVRLNFMIVHNLFLVRGDSHRQNLIFIKLDE